MGWDTTTLVRTSRGEEECKVLLEPGEVICRGPVRRTFKHHLMRELSAKEGWLSFLYEDERISIRLDDNADAWRDAIANPRTRTQKLGVEVGMKVVILGPAEEDAVAELAAASGVKPSARLSKDARLVLLFAEDLGSLERLVTIAPSLAPKGAVWVLWPKGRKDLAHEHVVSAAKRAGLSQTRSMGFSERLTGLRLVRPSSTGSAAKAARKKQA